TRTTTTRYYGDTNLDGALTLNQPFSAGGKFNATAFHAPDIGTGLVLGHFAAGGVGQVGIVFNNDAANLYWRAYIRLNDGTDVNTLANVIGANVARTWDYTWDPAGGTQGGGLLSVTVSGPGGGTQTIDLNPAQRALGSTVDAFGLSSRPAVSSNSSQFVDLVIDDVSYAAVPEPSTLALLGVAALAGIQGCRARRRLSKSGGPGSCG
ncbi:MAG TPA: PEP-CTERM sorting domain-containing protein, partial [Gemmataceae bacterium]|nr:PEP-CTERM sorting domain-containing protein [Gemmataceae bacterium]